jgi:prepilin-type processing-associated H-X9-DG protein
MKIKKNIYYYFTIIELLIVIVIIALLAAILLPSLQKAKAKSESISCLSQLKQLGVGYNQYINEYNRTVPVYINGNRWYNFLSPYLGNACDDKISSILVCPQDYRNKTNNKISYGINQCYSPSYKDNKEYKLWYSVNSNKIVSFSKFISFADSVDYYIGTVIEDNVYGKTQEEFAIISGWGKNLSFRHGNERKFNFNASFADGHCESLTLNTVTEALFDLNNLGNYSSR